MSYTLPNDLFGMHCLNPCETRKIPSIERQNSLYIVYAHGRNEARVMHLNPGNVIVDKQPSPLVMYRQTIGKQA